MQRIAGGYQRHQEFQKYFAVQYPLKPVPSRDTHPNWKVDPFLRHLNKVFINAVFLGEYISCDKESIQFTGRSSFKLRLKFKKVNEVLQDDFICSNGYTFSFYFRHQKAPKKYLEKDFAPLHARVAFLFDQLHHKNHSCFMDNLYMSALFALRSLNLLNAVKIHGVTLPSLKGVPSCVHQDKYTNEQRAEEAKGTIKVAKLVGEAKCKNLLAISYYDSKPIYFLSTVLNEVKWDENQKQVYSKALNKMVNAKFLRPNFVNIYNFNMNSVDQADQLRQSYQMGTGLWYTKWWWTIN